MARYIAPVSRKSKPSASATASATVDLPVPAGPSIVMTMLLEFQKLRDVGHAIACRLLYVTKVKSTARNSVPYISDLAAEAAQAALECIVASMLLRRPSETAAHQCEARFGFDDVRLMS